MNTINIKNKKVFFDFELFDKFDTGIVLLGTEIKSIRQGKVSLADAFCYVKDNEVWVKNMNIAMYDKGSHYNHEPGRDRKLLLKKRECRKIFLKTRDSGNTVVPLRIYINEKGLAKLEIAVARGKKKYDRREDIKRRDAGRDMDRAMKK